MTEVEMKVAAEMQLPKFAGLDYKDWETYEPRESERAVFRKNRALAKLFEEELDRQLQQPH